MTGNMTKTRHGRMMETKMEATDMDHGGISSLGAVTERGRR
jgi:hypothetical protein